MLRNSLFVILVLSLLILIIIFLYQPKASPIPTLSGITNKITSSSSPLPQLNVTSIFAVDHSWTKNLDQNKTVTLIATGDIIPARVTNIQATQRNDFTWSFKNIANTLKSGDITFINLESPLISNCPLINDGFKFCGDVRHLQGLLFAGVDIASLANNHAGNFGTEGVQETVNLLNSNGIETTGVDQPAFKEIKDTKFAFLGYNDIGNYDTVLKADDQKVCEDIKTVRSHADIVVVTYHWGIEYQSQPNQRQKDLGHLSIDCGADLVIGNHPHWIQPIEFYNDKLITYAHGNTVFDQEWSLKTKQGVVGRYTFFNKKLIDVEYLPLLIENYGQPHFLEGNGKQKILDEMKNQTEILATSSGESI